MGCSTLICHEEQQASLQQSQDTQTAEASGDVEANTMTAPDTPSCMRMKLPSALDRYFGQPRAHLVLERIVPTPSAGASHLAPVDEQSQPLGHISTIAKLVPVHMQLHQQ